MSIPAFTKQKSDQPLFPDILWNRPTTRRRAGRLLVVGGHRDEFSLLQAIYQAATTAGIGECQAVIPDSLRRAVGESGFGRFVPASGSGSLGKAALGELLQLAGDTDAVIVGANLTSNAETAVVIESLLIKCEQPIVVTEETIHILQFHPELITGNPKALVVVTMPGLFALAGHHRLPITIRPDGGVVGKIEILQQLAAISHCSYLVFDGEVLVHAEGQTSLTTLNHPLSALPAAAVGVGATLWVQEPSKPYAALTTAAYILAAATRESATNYSSINRQIRAALEQLEA